MKKVFIATVSILVFVASACISHGHVCNTYTDNTPPIVEKNIQDL